MYFFSNWRPILVLVLVGVLYMLNGCTATDSESGSGSGSETQTAQLSVSKEPAEAGETSLSSGTYKIGQELELEATPNEGWQFAEWTGDTSSTENPLGFTLQEDMSITAVFTELEPDQYQLMVDANPSEGGSVDPSSGAFEEGAEVQIEATSNEGWNFTGWSGDLDSDENPVTVTMDSTIELSANFEAIMVDLSVAADPSEGGSVDPSSGTFQFGENVEVAATPNEGWQFAEWTGDRSSTENPLSFTIKEDVSLTAVFSEIPEYQLAVEASPSEGGSVEPASGTYQEGTQVEVSATPSEGWEFVEWTGDRSATENPMTVTMDGDVDLTAVFSEIPRYELTVNASPAEGGSVDPTGGTYQEGTEVEVSATPNKHWTFVGWTGDINSTTNPETATINSNTDITANFEQTARPFLDSVQVADSQNSNYLYFGMKEGASSGFDDSDRDAPPRPPQGSFYAELLIENYSLFRDMRPISSSQVVWELAFAPEEGQGPITIRWEFAETQHIGELRLVDDPQNPSIDIDMKSQTSHEVSSSVNTLYIISN